MAALAVNQASNAIDRQKFRSEYMNELAHRSALDQQVYNGTILYQKTGVPPTPVADMTSVSDRMSMVEQNKIALRQALLAITDPSNAQKIVDSLPITSIMPLLNAMPRIIQKMKPMYQFGVLAPEFLTYVNREFLPDLEIVQSPSIGNGELLASFQDIRSQLPTIGDLMAYQNTVQDSLMPETVKESQLRRIADYKNALNQLNGIFGQIAKMVPEEQAQKLRELNDTIKDVILPRDAILEMTRDQSVANAMRVRELNTIKLNDAARNLQQAMRVLMQRNWFLRLPRPPREIVPTVEAEEELVGAVPVVETAGAHGSIAPPVEETKTPEQIAHEKASLALLKASLPARRPLRSTATAAAAADAPDLTAAETAVLAPIPVPEIIAAPSFERPLPPKVGRKDYLTKPFEQWTIADYEYSAADETAANMERRRLEEAKLMSPEVAAAIDTGEIDQITAANLLMQMAAPSSSQTSFVSPSGVSRIARIPRKAPSVSPQIQSILQAAPIDDETASIMSDVTMTSPFEPSDDNLTVELAAGGGRRKGPTLHEIKSFDDFMRANIETQKQFGKYNNIQLLLKLTGQPVKGQYNSLTRASFQRTNLADEVEKRFRDNSIHLAGQLPQPSVMSTFGSFLKDAASGVASDLGSIVSNVTDAMSPVKTRQRPTRIPSRHASVASAIEAEPHGKGEGLYKHHGLINHKVFHGKGFESSNVDFSKGVKKEPMYVPFGKHFINKTKLLGRGILMLRRKGGNTISSLPTVKISDELKNVIAGLIENMNPSFGSIANLSPEDKDLYNKVIRETSIDQRLLIPSPTLDEDQKTWHRFQVLAGELNAGNDSPEMIKEMKKLLVILANKQMLPKGQCRELILDICALGF